MNLKKVKINNFRSLKDIEVPMSRNTIIIGENNSGKTAFLDAVRIGLGRINRKISPFHEYDYYVEDETSTPQDSEGITLQFFFEEETPNQWNEKILQVLGEVVQPKPWYKDNRSAVNTITLKVFSVYDESMNDYTVDVKFLNIKGEELSRIASNKLSDFLLLTPIFYLQALRDITNFFGSNSPFWGRFLKKINIPAEKLIEIQTNLALINDEIISSDSSLEHMIKSLENIHRVLSLSSTDVVSINALPLKAWDILSKAQVVMKGKGSEVVLPLDRHGQGTQSLATLFLFQAYIDVILQTTFTTETEAILALEEPEAHLHPQASRSLANKIKNIDCQKVISTHSPYFIQNIDLMDLRIFRKLGKNTSVHYLNDSVTLNLGTDAIKENLERFVISKGADRYILNKGAGTITTFIPVSDQEANGLLGMYRQTQYESKIEDFIRTSQTILPENEKSDLYTFIQRTRGELFFARGWFLAEGQTEYIVINYFAELIGHSFDDCGISIIDYQNNGSPGAFIKVAKLLGYPWVLVSDDDAQGVNTIQQIKKIGYADTELRDLVKLLPYKDFETYLANEGFEDEFVEILTEKGQTVRIDALGLIDKEHLVELIQKDKVGNANKLVEKLRQKSATPERVPALVKDLIERCVAKTNE